jgi:hypothetical protein
VLPLIVWRRLVGAGADDLAHARIAAQKSRAGGGRSHRELSNPGRRIRIETGTIERSQFAPGPCEVLGIRLGGQRHEIAAGAGIGRAGGSELRLRGGAEPDYGDDEKERDEYGDSVALHHFTALRS